MKNSNTTKVKIDALIEQMTIEEKIGQMFQIHKGDDSLAGGLKQAIKAGLVGSVINANNAEQVNDLQRIAVEESRLGIPILMARDVIHGFRTIFPIPLGQASSWNPKVVEKGARVAAIEASGVGIHWTFAPSVDVTRDPRWGRIAETCGEDPYLTSVLGAAAVRGFQGKDLSDKDSIAACAKHFAGYGAAEGGRDYNTAFIPEDLLRDVYLPPFKAATEAGVATFMCSFNEINGIPSSGNAFLFQKVLREEWNFDGFVVSDWESITEMIMHGFCEDAKAAAYEAAHAGIDMEMVSKSYLDHIPELLAEGKISVSYLDEAVRNILQIKFRLGLFEDPYVDLSQPSTILSTAHLEAAKVAAIESIVLLKNEDDILPLSKKVGQVAVIGPLADAPQEQLGTWIFDGEPEDTVTPLTAIKELIGGHNVSYNSGLDYSRDNDKKDFLAAAKIAREADVVLLFVGEEAILSGEAHARSKIDLPGAQSALIDVVAETGTPLIMIVQAGRPLTIGAEVEKASALLYAWHPGTMGGPALADLIFGLASPSAKLPVTFPKAVGQIPIYYSHKNTGRPVIPDDMILIDDIPVGASQTSLPNTSHYLDIGFEPLYPFGFGLSYTTFEYANLRLDKSSMAMNEVLKVSIDVTNTGNHKGAEVVQLYIQDLFGSLTRPVKELKSFQKVSFNPGETKTLSFQLTEPDFAFHRRDMSFGAEAGDFNIFVGSSSRDVLKMPFKLSS